ncbi:carbamoyl phosphate synthase [Arcobacter sp. CECT 8983]|uniref:ATP-grasp domain-containing protein n=1 Tax=Arcobacter sp. CECT 8983 TaxID=2044508 RepID=UPI00100BFDED|nr:ATP-grasp domain-containing protein [Arcobacter sp. CECT 8983]RXJ90602.1 carbamoyl phosphate synthase [Arcobacter sp. CECT 8983]
MKKINVLVTGIGGGSHGEQIIKSLKLINDLDLTIIGTDVTSLTTGKNLVDKFYLVPYVADKKYEKIIFDIIKENNISFIFHGSEPELKFISENREKFENANVKHPLNSKEAISLCMNKYETYKYLETKGVNLPKFKKIDKIEDINEIDFYPLVLKPSTGSGGSSDVYIALDKEDCQLLVKYMLKHNVDIVAQHYIGTHEDEYTIGVSSDINGKVLGSIAIKRFITNALSTYKKVRDQNNIYVISSGISQGKVCHNANLQKQAEHIAELIDSKGPLNIQCREVNGELMLFEINPRLSGTTSLRAIAGYNEPELMIKHQILGEKWNHNYNNSTIMRTIEEVEISE